MRRSTYKISQHVPAAPGARAILEAATAMFAAEGFDAVSVAAIAAKAGVCKANVFHHFPTKDHLFLAVMQDASSAHADYAEQLYHAPGNCADKVRLLLEFEIRHMLGNRQRARLTLRELSDNSHAPVRKVARQVFQRNYSAVVGIFEQGRQRGEFRPDLDPAAAAILVVGATMLYFNCHEVLREFRETGTLDTPDAYATRIASLILSGAAASPRDMVPPRR